MKSWVLSFKKLARSSARIPQCTAHKTGASSFKLSPSPSSSSSTSSSSSPCSSYSSSSSGTRAWFRSWLPQLCTFICSYILLYWLCVPNTVWGFLTQNFARGYHHQPQPPSQSIRMHLFNNLLKTCIIQVALQAVTLLLVQILSSITHTSFLIWQNYAFSKVGIPTIQQVSDLP